VHSTLAARTLAIPLVLAALVGCEFEEGEFETELSQQASMHDLADIRVMTYNIKNSFGDVISSESGNPWCVKCETNSLQEIGEHISDKQPDIVALQEIGTRMRDAEFEDQLRSLSEYTGLPYYYQLNYKDLENQTSVPIWLDSHGPAGMNGVAILSRWPFVGHPEELRLVRDPDTAELTDYTPMNLEPAALRVTVNAPLSDGDTLIDIYSVHLYSEALIRREQAHLIDRWSRPNRPALLMGDLNSEPDELDTVLGWSNPLTTELISYPAWEPAGAAVRRQIDYVLTRNFDTSIAHDACASGGTDTNALPIASDHLAITYDLELSSCPSFSTSLPDWTFCSAASSCPRCGEGKGDCDSDADCAEGLVCATDTGPDWGLPAGYDVCEVPGSPTAIPATRSGLSTNLGGPASSYPSTQSFPVTVSDDATFDIQLTYSTSEERQIAVFVDGRRMEQMTLLEDTGDWGGVGLWETVEFHHLPMKAGDHVVTFDLGGDSVNIDRVRMVLSREGPWQQLTFPISEGILEAEYFDVGGHVDTTPGNQGNGFRTGDVDVYKHSRGSLVRWFAGEEIQYALTTPAERVLDLQLRYKAPAQATIHIEIDGVDATGPILLLSTTNGSSLEWGDKFLRDIVFPEGSYSMRVVVDSGSGSFDFFRFLQSQDSGPLAGEPFAVGTRIEAEYYDLGGSWDNSAGNAGEMYRWDDVELWDDRTGHDPSGEYLVWGTEPGEWLEYTILVDADGLHDIDVRYATPFANRTITLEIDGVVIVNQMSLPLTGGWGQYLFPPGIDTWMTATESGVWLDEGTHTLRVNFDTGLMNLDYLKIR
jgi:endonuclease/exonuclease/phosphatase family metal-dependent hydrolase